MLVIKSFLFDDKCMTVSDFCENLKRNRKEFLYKCRQNKSVFGMDEDSANLFAEKITADIFSFTENKKPYLGQAFIPASIQFNSQANAGEGIGATPDGREAGAPLCDSLGAVFGKDKNGPTSLLKSVVSIHLEKALGVPILNFNIDESWNDEILKSLLLSYLQMGGIQMQISCISAETLKDAYKHPVLPPGK